ncbi:zinc finger HIT domain-containing protein 2 [Drosophila novamexicana]|uniref:zinc finger HIT domain-containing protein 2 n=1 Tax=Drosophila novamexicana TaxID=47314 RepID=UPI0011E5DD9B|nr:zinc finger HIT domain-containing protein 2 [Drosophila novamexicana]
MPEMSEEKCHFCHEAPFKYTCPKCNAIYCSVACYKSKEHLKCSEEFYKTCIQDELASAATTSESNKGMREIYDILKRMHKFDAGFKPEDFDADGLDSPLDSDDEAKPEQDDEGVEGDDGTEYPAQEETDETVDIAERLKGIDINDADEVWSRLTTDEQQEFQKLIASGDIMKLMPDYKPWWCKPKNSKIVVMPSATDVNVDMPQIQKNIPKFTDLCKTPSPCLHYNLWNILSAYACVARFFGGEQRTNASEAVAHLVNLSATLKYGTNFEDAEDAIISVEMEACTTGNGSAGAAVVGSAGAGTNFLVESREQLQEDARQLMSTQRNKLAALSDVLQLLQQSKVLSRRKNSEEAEFQKLFALASGSVVLNRTKLSQLVKKIEFMLSYVAREQVL